ncbi:hypothetical protein HK103_004007 [Boothiomyces macroporosus]|uniref:Apple domain-containing protein n=1 Tax=Boothiomyces macroporosus TaxID=261099 RepID=A0AAD5UL37_9FUNG|nr:hypothetical protein HK103_004007 [Boothiomyces macroporosus]
MVDITLNLEDSNQGELRQRHARRPPAPPRIPKPSVIRETIHQIKGYFDNSRHHEYKKSKFQNFKFLYIVFVGLVAGILGIYAYTVSRMKQIPVTNDAPIMNDAVRNGLDLEKSKSTIVMENPAGLNHLYDHIAFSLHMDEQRTGETPVDLATFNREVDFITNEIGPFLHQVNNLQLHDGKNAREFIHGKIFDSFVQFPKTTTAYPNAEKYIGSLKALFQHFPKAEWFVSINDETYVFVENTREMLKQFNSNKPLVLLNFDVVDVTANSHYTKSESAPISTTIMSRAAMEIVFSYDFASCLNENTIPHEETALSKCFAQAGIQIVRQRGMHKSEPSHDFAWPKNPCELPWSISNLTPNDFQRIYSKNPSTGVNRSGQTFRWDILNTYADLLHITYNTDVATRGIDRHVGTTSIITPAISGNQCMKICKSDKHCLSWTYSELRCFTSNGIGAAIEADKGISGIIPSRYICGLPLIF